jgi:hypothetical protein
MRIGSIQKIDLHVQSVLLPRMHLSRQREIACRQAHAFLPMQSYKRTSSLRIHLNALVVLLCAPLLESSDAIWRCHMAM